MKSIKLLLPLCLLMTIIFSSCGGGHKDQLFDYLAVKTKKDANKISLIDFEGKIVAEDEFGDLYGKLVCDDNHSCKNIPYSLNNGKDHIKVLI